MIISSQASLLFAQPLVLLNFYVGTVGWISYDGSNIRRRSICLFIQMINGFSEHNNGEMFLIKIIQCIINYFSYILKYISHAVDSVIMQRAGK